MSKEYSPLEGREIKDAFLEVSDFSFCCHQCGFENRYMDTSKMQDYYKDHFLKLQQEHGELKKAYLELRDKVMYIKGELSFL